MSSAVRAVSAFTAGRVPGAGAVIPRGDWRGSRPVLKTSPAAGRPPRGPGDRSGRRRIGSGGQHPDVAAVLPGAPHRPALPAGEPQGHKGGHVYEQPQAHLGAAGRDVQQLAIDDRIAESYASRFGGTAPVCPQREPLVVEFQSRPRTIKAGTNGRELARFPFEGESTQPANSHSADSAPRPRCPPPANGTRVGGTCIRGVSGRARGAQGGRVTGGTEAGARACPETLHKAADAAGAGWGTGKDRPG